MPFSISIKGCGKKEKTSQSETENASDPPKHQQEVEGSEENIVEQEHFSPARSPLQVTHQHKGEYLGDDFLKATDYFNDDNTQGCSIM